jgi:hypothetical protein
MRERYDKSNPDPEYHAMWSRRLADRAAMWSYLAMVLAFVAFILAIVSAVIG